MAKNIPGIFSVQQTPARPANFYTITTQNRFNLDYRGMNYVYFFSDGPFILTVYGYSSQNATSIDIPGNTWFPVLFPETTQMQSTANMITVQCTDVPIQVTSMQVPRLISDMLELDRQDVGNSWSSGQLSGSAWSELAIDFSIYAISGGNSPTVTFLVSRVGLDSKLYKLEQAAPLSAPGTISYSIGAGLDGKSFAGTFQIDMVVTGNPTNVNISGSVKAKQ